MKPNQDQDKTIDLQSIRDQMARSGKENVWRSFDELAETPQFKAFLHQEFPRQASALDALSRRDFLKLLAAPLALAGLSACVPQPIERIAPYNESPEELRLGDSLFFATAMQLGGFARGLLAKSSMGRPIKLEGNPDHPASLGATDAFAQGSILTLYDPDRAQVVTSRGRIRSNADFQAELRQALTAQEGNQGAGLRVLTGTVTSPTLAAQLEALLERFPRARWHQYDAVSRDNVRQGAMLAFGEAVETHYRFENAQIILSLDNDFTLVEPGNLRYVREFTDRRRVLDDQVEMNRLYVVESSLTNAGAIADHRLPMKASQVQSFARLLAQQLGLDIETRGDGLETEEIWIAALLQDLQANPGASLILAGVQQPPEVHALAHAMNRALGNIGSTVIYTDPVELNPLNQLVSIQELVVDLNAGAVDLLVMLGGNPAYAAPVDLNFPQALSRAGLQVYLGLYEDETAALSSWHIPGTHFLEMWSDARAYDGAVSIIQPLIEPLYESVSPHELLALLLGDVEVQGYDILRQFWQERSEVADFEAFWRRSLHDGVMPDSTLPEKEVIVSPDLMGQLNQISDENRVAADELEILFQPDPSVWDGRFTNNAWLQELPRPMTKLTWDNAVLISPSTALRLGLSNEEVVNLRFQDFEVAAPVWILPGQPDNSVTVNLGYGRQRGGRLIEGVGFNANAIRTTQAFWFGQGLEIQKSGERYALATTQHHQSMEGRDFVRVADIQEFADNPDLFHAEDEGESASLYPEYEYDGHAWGMSINLNTCIGCNACVIACQAENNIPVVGKEQVQDGHEMHWLRIDRYFKGSLDNPEVLFQAVPCMHCEKAPCEPVCPVEATVHDEEGLNEMIYNRCVGTRYCSNNCPYKVRRFNFLQYADEDSIPLKMMRNPDVSVRSRGVMEKCTYCVQRINTARIQAEVEGRALQDGEIKTACQQACPTNAIVFGDINDPSSQVSNLKQQPQNYTLLAELNTQPRTTYLAKLRNPNPMIET